MKQAEVRGQRVENWLARVLVVEPDDGMFMTMCRLLLGHAQVLRARTFDAAWQRARPQSWRDLPFDYVLLELALPDGDGADLLGEFDALEPRPGVAVITAVLDARRALALHGRCAIVVPKPVDRETLLGILGTLSAAGTSRSLVTEFARTHRLSNQETRLLLAAARNRTNDEAADDLGCASATVRSYWVRIFEKTGCHGAREVLARLFQFAIERRSLDLSRGARLQEL